MCASVTCQWCASVCDRAQWKSSLNHTCFTGWPWQLLTMINSRVDVDADAVRYHRVSTCSIIERGEMVPPGCTLVPLCQHVSKEFYVTIFAMNQYPLKRFCGNFVDLLPHFAPISRISLPVSSALHVRIVHVCLHARSLRILSY